MKITVRLPREAYAYDELEFDSLNEYEELYIATVVALEAKRILAKKKIEEEIAPF